MKKTLGQKIMGPLNNTRIYAMLGLIPFVILAVMFIYFAMVSNVGISDNLLAGDVCNEYNTGWEFVRISGDSNTVEIPFAEPNVPAGECVSFVNTLPDGLNDRDVLMTHLINQNANVYIDGKLRGRYFQDEGGLYKRDIASRYMMINLYEIDSGKEIRIDGYRPIDGSRRFTDCFIGTKNGLIIYILKSHIFDIGMALFFLVVGGAIAVTGMVLRIITRNAIRIDYIGWILFSVSLWDATQSEFRDLFFTNIKVASMAPSICLMLFAITVALFFNTLQNGRYGCLYTIYVLAIALYFVVTLILQILRIFDFAQAIYYVFGFIGLIVVIMIVTIAVDAKAGYAKGYLSICIGGFLLTVFGAAQTYAFVTDSFNTRATPLLVGTAAFCVCALIHTINDFLRIDSERKAAIATADIRSQFLANMSHEIRTPINAILGMNEMILRESHEEDISTYAADVDSAGKLLLVLVNDILDFSKLESGKMNLVDADYNLKTMILAAYNLIKTRAQEKNLEVTLEVDENMPSKLNGDEVRIKQVLTNLITNAVKYTGKGSVGIKVFSTASSDGGFVLNIHVRDTGMGIREEDKDKLFEAFARLDEKKNRTVEGTGLGLPITGQLVKLMNGTIEVDSVYGQGSTFKVAIPQKVVSADPIGDITNVSFEDRVQKRAAKDRFVAPEAKILIVDDVAMNLRVATSLLKNTRIRVDTCSSGAECLEKICEEHYNVIMLDHMMPMMDGIETFHRFGELGDKNLNKNVPVIMLTANAVSGAREQFLDEGFDDYLSKPFSVSDLQKILIKHLPPELVTLI